MFWFQRFRLHVFETQLAQLVGDEIEKSRSCRLSGVAPIAVTAAELHQLVIQVLDGAYLIRLVLMTTAQPSELTRSDSDSDKVQGHQPLTA